MTKKAKILLTVAIVFTALTVLTICISLPLLLEYFRLEALPPADSVSQGISQGAGAAFSLVFFLIFSIIGGAFALPALITGIFAYRAIFSGKARYFALALWIFGAIYLIALGITLLCIIL